MVEDKDARIATLEAQLAETQEKLIEANDKLIRHNEALSRTGAVKVKGLEWVFGEAKPSPDLSVWIADAPGLNETYSVWHSTNPDAVAPYSVPKIHNGFYNSLDEAKAAAQADYERRILSALEPAAPEGQQPVAHAYVVNGECEQIEWGMDVDLPDDPALVLLYTRPSEQAVENNLCTLCDTVFSGEICPSCRGHISRRPPETSSTSEEQAVTEAWDKTLALYATKMALETRASAQYAANFCGEFSVALKAAMEAGRHD